MHNLTDVIEMSAYDEIHTIHAFVRSLGVTLERHMRIN